MSGKWIAVFSDVHGNVAALERVVADAHAWGATAFVNLGDVEGEEAMAAVHRVSPVSVFGNWEVSSWRSLPSPWRERVQNWPPRHVDGRAVMCHATPAWPSEVHTLEDAMTYVCRQGSWFSLFPLLDRDEEARWEAFAALVAQNLYLALHGHTHVQRAWVLTADNRMRPLPGPEFPLLDDGSLYIVGVGSVGRPIDRPGACYALWNPEAGQVVLRRLEPDEIAPGPEERRS